MVGCVVFLGSFLHQFNYAKSTQRNSLIVRVFTIFENVLGHNT